MKMKFNPNNGAWFINTCNYEQIKERLCENEFKIKVVEEFDPKLKPKVNALTKADKIQGKFLVRLSFTKPLVREELKDIHEAKYDMLENIWSFPLDQQEAVTSILDEHCHKVTALGKEGTFPAITNTAQYIGM